MSDHKFKIKAQDYLMLRQQASAKHMHTLTYSLQREDMHVAGCSKSMSRSCITASLIVLNQCQGRTTAPPF